MRNVKKKHDRRLDKVRGGSYNKAIDKSDAEDMTAGTLPQERDADGVSIPGERRGYPFQAAVLNESRHCRSTFSVTKC